MSLCKSPAVQDRVTCITSSYLFQTGWFKPLRPWHLLPIVPLVFPRFPDFYFSSFNFSSDHLFWTSGFLFNTSDSSVVVIVDSNVASNCICLLVIPSHLDICYTITPWYLWYHHTLIFHMLSYTRIVAF